MTLILYNTSDDDRKLYKDIGNPRITINNVKPYQEMSIITPVVLVTYNDAVYNCNYAYLDTTGRFYFIRDVELVPGNKMAVTLSIDVLYTYRDQIKNCSATIIRSESIGKPTMVVDNQLPIVQGRYNFTGQIFPLEPLNTDILTNTVLITLGG